MDCPKDRYRNHNSCRLCKFICPDNGDDWSQCPGLCPDKYAEHLASLASTIETTITQSTTQTTTTLLPSPIDSVERPLDSLHTIFIPLGALVVTVVIVCFVVHRLSPRARRCMNRKWDAMIRFVHSISSTNTIGSGDGTRQDNESLTTSVTSDKEAENDKLIQSTTTSNEQVSQVNSEQLVSFEPVGQQTPQGSNRDLQPPLPGGTPMIAEVHASYGSTYPIPEVGRQSPAQGTPRAHLFRRQMSNPETVTQKQQVINMQPVPEDGMALLQVWTQGGSQLAPSTMLHHPGNYNSTLAGASVQASTHPIIAHPTTQNPYQAENRDDPSKFVGLKNSYPQLPRP